MCINAGGMESKQRKVVAVVVKDGKIICVTTNEHQEPCKRIGYPTGEGYELCDGCNYPNHAEHKAMQQEGVEDGVLHLFGHTYACQPCKDEMVKKNVVWVIH